ncbi:MAG: hypothetical protein IKQ61_05225 [Spirochaetales bacterium]|nr:hypothetical protein [Spirochaetales bacterium]
MSNETTDTPKFQLPDDLVQSIGALNEMCSQQEDSAAAMMYRLMFRHESNINVLDRYADQILDALAGFGGEYAEEDYRNYLQYLQAVLPSEVPIHKDFFEEELRDLNDEDIEEDENL